MEMGNENGQQHLDWHHQSFDIGNNNTYPFSLGHDSQDSLVSGQMAKSLHRSEVTDGSPAVPEEEVGSRYRQLPKSHRPAWLATVSAGALLALATLGINTGIYVWLRDDFTENSEGIAVIFQGPCSKSSTLIDVSHLAINILSTLLLAASNNCAQLLASPTRADTDAAHIRGHWVHLGIVSLRNFRWISWWRTGLCCLLLLSSIPLHLLYNSVLFSSTYASDYFAAAVTEDFVHGGSWDKNGTIQLLLDNPSYIQAINYSQVLQSMQEKIDTLHQLNSDACRSAYNGPIVQAPYRSVLVVTNYTQNDSWIAGFFDTPELNGNDTLNPKVANDEKTGPSYTFQNWAEGALLNVTVEQLPCNRTNNNSLYFAVTSTANLSALNLNPDTVCSGVEYCLAEPAGNYSLNCTISANTTLLLAVIICNAIKAACLIITLISWRIDTLAVLGDAIASFMDYPDRTTKALGTLEYSTVRTQFDPQKGSFLEQFRETRRRQQWEGKQYRWAHVLDTATDGITFLGLIICWLLLLIWLPQTWTSSDLEENFSNQNAQASDVFSTTTTQSGSSLTAIALKVNSLQVIVSLVYAVGNMMLTRMLAANEYSQFAQRCRPLRVSRPAREQLSTHWLQLPYRYSVTLIVAMSLLHWLISRSIYLLNIRVYDINGVEDPLRMKYAWGTSSLAMLLTFLLGSALFWTLVGISRKKLGTGMPIVSTCSVAVSAACHPPVGEEGTATKPLMYGAIPMRMLSDSNSIADNNLDHLQEHASFSSLDVQPLIIGLEYDKQERDRLFQQPGRTAFYYYT